MRGEAFTGGNVEIDSERSGYALELAVDAPPIGGRRGARGGFGGGGARTRNSDPAPRISPKPSKNWPAGNIDLRIGDYMLGANQKWTITPVANAGGYLGSPYFKKL